MSSKHYDSHTHSDLSPSTVSPHGLDRRRVRSRQSELHLFEELVQLAPDATVVADTRGRIRLVNHQTEELFGYSADELLGQPVEMLLPERLQMLHQLHRKDYVAAPRVRPMGATLPLSGRRRDGSEFPLEASLGPLNEKGELLVIVSIRDITERQQAYAAHAAAEAANRDLRALQALTDTALSHLALDDLLPALLERLTQILQVDNAAVLLLDDDSQTLTMRAVRGLEEAVAAHVRVPLGHGFAGRIAQTREPLVVDDLATFPAVNPFLREQFRSIAGVPLLVDNHVSGVLYVGMAQSRHFSAHEVQLLQQVADRMAVSIERAHLYTAEQCASAEAEQRAAQLTATFDAMADGVVVFDAQGQLVRENEAHRRLLGIDCAAPHVAALPLSERLPLFALRDEHGRPLGLDEGPLPRALRGEVLGGAETMDLRLRTLDGREVELNVSAAPLRDQEGHLSGAVAIFRDQTEQKRLAQEREEAHARELAAQQVTEQMSAFLATAAHDIRNPLTVATAQVQMAQRRVKELVAALVAPLPTPTVTAESPRLLAERALESLEPAKASMGRLQRLVNLLFDVTQAQTHGLVLNLASVDLRALVLHQVAAQQLMSQGHRISVEVPDEAILVEADADRLEEVLDNFVSNALKYSSTDQPVEIRLEVVENHAVTSVIDHGPGIPPKEQRRIWETFYRSSHIQVQHDNGAKVESLGLGLHICKQLVELHPGGSVGVKSRVGEGSTFWFQLPLTS